MAALNVVASHFSCDIFLCLHLLLQGIYTWGYVTSKQFSQITNKLFSQIYNSQVYIYTISIWHVASYLQISFGEYIVGNIDRKDFCRICSLVIQTGRGIAWEEKQLQQVQLISTVVPWEAFSVMLKRSHFLYFNSWTRNCSKCFESTSCCQDVQWKCVTA